MVAGGNGGWKQVTIMDGDYRLKLGSDCGKGLGFFMVVEAQGGWFFYDGVEEVGGWALVDLVGFDYDNQDGVLWVVGFWLWQLGWWIMMARMVGCRFWVLVVATVIEGCGGQDGGLWQLGWSVVAVCSGCLGFMKACSMWWLWCQGCGWLCVCGDGEWQVVRVAASEREREREMNSFQL